MDLLCSASLMLLGNVMLASGRKGRVVVCRGRNGIIKVVKREISPLVIFVIVVMNGRIVVIDIGQGGRRDVNILHG